MRYLPLLLALILAAPASAQDATLAQARGKVQLRADGHKRWLPAKTGDTLMFGDAVRTRAKAQAHLTFKDGAAVLVRESSEFTLKGSPDRVDLAFKAGEFLIGLTKKLGEGRSFRVTTPAAVAAVRGTLFWGLVESDGKTSLAALENEVAVSAGGKTVILKPGQKTVVAKGSAPSEPAPAGIPPEYPKNFAIDGSLQGLDALLK